ncbi:IQ domain-containing protein H-like isoform X3 [Bombus pyrosoma]|uniref:IQ domain-containing protein H-like isoform X3 n=1 Tax=Bombus pyrosoma TaxID=396416 RepID=UPI001CB8BEB5|nr:IQ domain-containing protein H-like isoform X3 [Bombus pyrosoma]
MNRHHKLLQTEEIYTELIDLIKSAVKGIQEQVTPIKQFLGDRRKEIIKLSRTEKWMDNSLEFAQLFYDNTFKELISIERICEECLVRLNTNLLTATKGRAQPPSYLSPKEMRKVYKMCRDAFNETKENELSCLCTWENKLTWDLDDIQDILIKPKEMALTEFDEYDLKFIQEIVYLRTRMFSLPKKRIDVKSGHDILRDTINGKHRASIRLSLKTTDFLQLLKQREIQQGFSYEDELSKLKSLTFVDGKFKTNDTWLKILDVQGVLYGSLWHLALCPQIEKILTKRLVPTLRLNPRATFDFFSKITNFASFELSRTDLITLLKHEKDAIWLKSWKNQFMAIDGKHIAATLIQAFWRGCWLRRKKWLSECLYVAASLMWFFWISLKAKKEMHRRYLRKMLVSLQTTRDLTLKLSNEFDSITKQPHVVLHLPSIGHPRHLRQVFNPKMFTIYQNITILRICFVRNPNAEVIYILPVKPTEDLLTMYSDFIESISPDEDVAKRITFIALSQADCFKNLSLNVSRILHCSQESLNEIEKKIAGKLAYFLPYIVDECDMRLAGTFNVPLLSPDMEMQRKFLNASNMSEMIDSFGLSQLPYKSNITDYETLCSSLSELMVLHTEISMWLIKLNYGTASKQSAIFLINHISVPFMPMLRREREKHGDYWMEQPSLRAEFLQKMREHVPKIIPNVIRLSKMYGTWTMFYAHIQKFGCLLQAVPPEKNPKTIMVSLFVPGKATKKKPKWLGTADKINLEATHSTTIYMLPQTSLDIDKIKPTVNKFARGMQDKGYFGYLAIDCYCYLRKQEEILVVSLLNVFPYYSYCQNYIDWMEFAIGGRYNDKDDEFTIDTSVVPDVERKKSPILYMEKPSQWSNTVERYAIAITQLHHSKFPAYRWPALKNLFEECDIAYDRKRRQGSSIILHDGEIRNFGKMVAVSASMTATLTMVHKNLTKLHRILNRSKTKSETNLPTLIDFFLKLSLDYRNLATDKCLSHS